MCQCRPAATRENYTLISSNYAIEYLPASVNAFVFIVFLSLFDMWIFLVKADDDEC